MAHFRKSNVQRTTVTTGRVSPSRVKILERKTLVVLALYCGEHCNPHWCSTVMYFEYNVSLCKQLLSKTRDSSVSSYTVRNKTGTSAQLFIVKIEIHWYFVHSHLTSPNYCSMDQIKSWKKAEKKSEHVNTLRSHLLWHYFCT